MRDRLKQYLWDAAVAWDTSVGDILSSSAARRAVAGRIEVMNRLRWHDGCGPSRIGRLLKKDVKRVSLYTKLLPDGSIPFARDVPIMRGMV